MSAEDRAAQRRIPDDQFNEILRVIRETVRAEMRVEREWSLTPEEAGMVKRWANRMVLERHMFESDVKAN